MGIDCTGMGGSGNVKSQSRASLLPTQRMERTQHTQLTQQPERKDRSCRCVALVLLSPVSAGFVFGDSRVWQKVGVIAKHRLDETTRQHVPLSCVPRRNDIN